MCAIAWDNGVFGWVRCDALDLQQVALATLPVLAPDPASVPATPTPVIYSDADVVRLLQQCRLVYYATTHARGNPLNLIDGSSGYVPYSGLPGTRRPQLDEIGALIRSNRQRCGFLVGQVIE